MDAALLGTGGMMPMPERLTTSVLVRSEGRMLLFDAGEGIQLALKRGGLGIRGLAAIAVSHLHADHVLGIPGILMFRAQADDPGPLAIVGPPGLERFVRHTLEDLRYRLNFELSFVEWSEGAPLALEWAGHSLFWEPLDHSTFCLGYRLEEATRPGKFNPDAAAALGVPPGPLRGTLQAGEGVTLADGRRVEPGEVLGPPRRGRVLSFATDTRPCAGLARALRNADLAFVEGMFASRHAAEAAEKKHMTALESATAAAEAGVSRLVLVHISPRYRLDEEPLLAEEASAAFPGVEVGKALETYAVPLPD
ncbi:MAG: ribonuclease Z [Deltaproteobacteria bacterium]|nr:ribonuclease Z [Deltaproteobacteria bacterium]